MWFTTFNEEAANKHLPSVTRRFRGISKLLQKAGLIRMKQPIMTAACPLQVVAGVAFVAVCTSISFGEHAPRRTVNTNVVLSSADPSVRIVVPKHAHYVGTDLWVLYGIANCQQFVFAQPDERDTVKRLYWVQFEAYVASMPKLHHLYSSKRHAILGGLDFYVDTWIDENAAPKAHATDIAALERYLRSKGYAVPAAINSGSDTEHVDTLLAAKRYRLPPVTASVRLVHLADAAARKELMIIYAEDLTGTRLTPADTKEGAAGYDRWKSVEAGLIRAAEANITILPGLP